MEKKGFIVGGIAGKFKANELNKEEREALSKEYGHDPDSLDTNLVMRGGLGDVIGTGSGVLLGRALTMGQPEASILPLIAGLAGGLWGFRNATKAYSKENAKKIMEKNEKADK